MTSCAGPGSSIKKTGIAQGDDREISFEEISESEKQIMRNGVIKALKQGLHRYTLSPGDVVEVMYHIKLKKDEQPYILGVSDEVNVEFYYHPDLNRTLVVRPDGSITLPIKGSFIIAGKTPEEAARIIAARYSDICRDPVVTVVVNKFSSKLMDLQKAITNSPRGQAKRVPIAPDGYLSLPLVKSVKAAGKTVDQLTEEVNTTYKREFQNLTVSILLDSIVGNQIFVFGEVNNPGAFTQQKPVTVMQAVAQAGGLTEEGCWDNVKIMYVSHNNIPVIRTVDVQKVFEQGAIEEDMIVPPNAVIFVPKTKIATVGKFVDQVIRRILTWNGAGWQFDYIVNPR
jgi:polysaccharide export outer membrane protein